MDTQLRVLLVDASTAFYRMNRYKLGDFFGPIDLGLYMSGRHNSLNLGVGLLAGSIFPGSNRLMFTGFSPCWGGFFISSMGGAGLVFENLGINMLSVVGRAPTPSILYLNRVHGEEIEVELLPVEARRVWKQEPGGVYAMMAHVHTLLAHRYENDPRVLAVGQAATATDFGAICSVPIVKGQLTHVDTWAGRGGFGSKLWQQHGIAAIVYGGTFIDDDYRDRKVADQWFMDKYQKKLAAKDLEATTKYRFEPKFQTGGTFGVNYSTLKGSMLSFNYQSMHMTEEERLRIHNDFVVNHYLKQFNEETIVPKQQKTCGEPCVAVCKKMNGPFKKDYEPYQVMGPLSGIFDQRAAEKVNHCADTYGFDAISAGGVLAWLMDCLAMGTLSPQELGVEEIPVFTPKNFEVVSDSMHNANIAVALLDGIIAKRGLLDFSGGARQLARNLAAQRGKSVLDAFVYNAFGRKGWMVPNQYWTPGAFSPMAVMGKYYMHYGQDFIPPRELGRKSAQRFKQELIMDNLGVCRFHRAWAEEMLPEIMESLYGKQRQFNTAVHLTASRINSRNASLLWESDRTIDIIYSFLKRKQTTENHSAPDLLKWIAYFEQDKPEAALDFWYEMHKGIQASLRDF